jgi:competence protein ComEC
MMLALVLLPIKVISLFMLSAGAYVVKLMYEMVKWVAQLPGSSIDGIHINSVQLIAIYLVIISITYLFPYYIKVRDLRSLRKDT